MLYFHVFSFRHHALLPYALFQAPYLTSIRSLSGTMLYFHAELLTFRSFFKQPLSALAKASFLTVNCHIHIWFWQSQQPHITHLYSPCHLDMQTLSLFPLCHLDFLPAPLPLHYFTYISCQQNFWKCFGSHSHSGTFTVGQHCKLYTQSCVSLCSQVADPTQVNITFRQAILCDAYSDHHYRFSKVKFPNLAFESFLTFSHLIPPSLSISHSPRFCHQHAAD